MIVIHALKQLGFISRTSTSGVIVDELDTNKTKPFGLDTFIDTSKFEHFTYFAIWSAVGSYAIFFGLGGFLHVSSHSAEMLENFDYFLKCIISVQ